MSRKRLTVIIPSRSQDAQVTFLNRSVRSIRNQTIAEKFDITIIVAVDKGDALSPDLCASLNIRCVESEGKSQVLALNAAIRVLDCDYVAFLEDDDRWQPHFLEIADIVLEYSDFVSSNQLVFDEEGNVVEIFDFPTPSGWIMPLGTLRQVGEFNEQYRYHLDTEWIGRLNRSGLRRSHLIESKTPEDINLIIEERIHIKYILEASSYTCKIVRHSLPFPLVQRYSHSISGMAQIGSNEESKQRSLLEYEHLTRDFGCIPT